jgi:hypothetical protein
MDSMQGAERAYRRSGIRARVLCTTAIALVFEGCVLMTQAVAGEPRADASANFAQALLSAQSYNEFDAAAYYAWGMMGGIPGYGTLSPGVGAPATSVYGLDFNTLDGMTGFGVSVNARRVAPTGWFVGAGYTGFFTDDTSSTGPVADTNTVFAALLDRTLANNVLDNTFDDGKADAARESIDIKRHQADFTFGSKKRFTPWLETYWQTGLRLAAINVQRDLLYENLAAGVYQSSAIALKSDMIGTGPTIGFGSTLNLTDNGWALKGSASASLLTSRFKLSRSDTDISGATARGRSVDLTTYGVVPMLDASIELSKTYGNFYFGLGYTISAAFGGGRTLMANGTDDVDQLTAAYSIEKNDIINQGVFARAGYTFGPEHAGPRGDGLLSDGGRTAVDGRIYYAFGAVGGTPGFGTLTPGPTTASYNLDFTTSDNQSGFGVTVDARHVTNSGWFAGARYTGFFTDNTSQTGTASADTDSVFTSYLDRSFADDTLNGNFDDGKADAATETIKIKRHQGDLVLGNETAAASWLTGAWHAGLRVASINVDRDILYENLAAGVYQSASISLQSDMIGGGPTFGTEGSIKLSADGWSLQGAAAASLLVSRFDLNRTDTYKANPASIAMRSVELTDYGVVPMFDASLELTKVYGSAYFGIGYTFSAALGGGRTIVIAGQDDVDGQTTPYAIEKNDIINHGVYARAGYLFGGPAPKLNAAAPVWAKTVVDAKVYYAWGRMGGTPGYGSLTAGPTADAYALNYNTLDDLDGFGVTADVRRVTAAGWFAGARYNGIFTDETSSAGTPGVSIDSLHASLLDRSLANIVLNSNFDDGKTDAATETIKINRNHGDLVLGHEATVTSWLAGSWHAGLRIASINVDRDVLYQTITGGVSKSADIALKSDMIGLGPTAGISTTLDLWGTGLVLKSAASGSLLASRFNLSRSDVYQSGATTGTRSVDMTTYGVVPMVDTSIELGATFGRFYAGVGYTVSAALNGGRTILSSANDDVDGATSPYTTEGNDIINQGVFARASYTFGGDN